MNCGHGGSGRVKGTDEDEVIVPGGEDRAGKAVLYEQRGGLTEEDYEEVSWSVRQ